MEYFQKPQRFFWVDALRGLAAFTIIFFHYHHFYLKDAFSRGDIPSIENFPYASVFRPLFSPWAANAVELFWLISGFVFVHVYLARKITAWDFGLARFARLYPLHLATLLYVAVLQWVSVVATGHWQIYANNDLRHLALQLIMASNWSSLSLGLSFNGPIWSVSFEIVIYVVFFVSLFAMRRAPVFVAAFLCLLCWFMALSKQFDIPLIRRGVFECGGYFFVGSLLYLARPYETRVRSAALLLLGLAGFTIGILIENESLTVMGVAISLLSMAAGLDLVAPELGRRLGGLGDISYSLYLVHVPLQMTTLLIADIAFGGTRAFAGSLLTLPIYVLVCCVLAIGAYRRLEYPAGRFLRRSLTRPNVNRR